MAGESLGVRKRPNIETANRNLSAAGLGVEYFHAFEQSEHDFHTHDFVEFLFVMDGTFRHITADRTYDESSGGVTILNYGQYHSLKTPNGPVELMNLYWNPTLYPLPDLPGEMAALIHELIPPHPSLGHRLNRIRHLEVPDPGVVKNLLGMMFHEQEEPARGHEAALGALFKLFLIELCRAVPAVSRDRDESGDYQAEKIRRFLDNNFRKALRLRSLCEMSGLKPANLCRRFKAHTGLSTGDYLKQRRLGAALKMLRETDYKIVTICNDCGFSDVSRFNRDFRGAFGCTPSEYRRRVCVDMK